MTTAERLIRALRAPEVGEDQARWVARWTALLDDATIEDAQAAIVDLLQHEARIQQKLLTAARRAGHPDTLENGESVPRLRRARAVCKAQRKFLNDWIRDVREDERQEAKRIAREAEMRRQQAALQLKRERIAAQERAAAANAQRQESIADVRAYKYAIVERERRLLHDRVVALDNGHAPDIADEPALIFAARHVILNLMRRLKDLGVEKPLTDEEQLVANLLQAHTQFNILECAVAAVDSELSAGRQLATTEGKTDGG